MHATMDLVVIFVIVLTTMRVFLLPVWLTVLAVVVYFIVVAIVLVGLSIVAIYQHLVDESM